MNLLMEMAVKSGVLMIIGTVVYEIITIPLEMTYIFWLITSDKGDGCTERKHRDDEREFLEIFSAEA